MKDNPLKGRRYRPTDSQSMRHSYLLQNYDEMLAAAQFAHTSPGVFAHAAQASTPFLGHLYSGPGSRSFSSRMAEFTITHAPRLDVTARYTAGSIVRAL